MADEYLWVRVPCSFCAGHWYGGGVDPEFFSGRCVCGARFHARLGSAPDPIALAAAILHDASSTRADLGLVFAPGEAKAENSDGKVLDLKLRVLWGRRRSAAEGT